MNLIEQHNVLKGLPDEELPKLAQQGETPAFLVLSEINRRKQTRERYEGSRAKYQQQNRSVAEELMGGKILPRISQLNPQQAAAGLDMAAPQQQQMPRAPVSGGLDAAVPAFAEGGYVEDYNQMLSDRLSGLGAERDRARAFALISAGAGMMGGTSPNAFTNIGAGINAALPQYQRSLEGIDDTEMDLAQLRFNAERQEYLDSIAADDRLYNRGQDTIANERAQDALAPADVREALWYETATPEQKEAYDSIRSANNTRDNKDAEAAYNNVYRATEKKYFTSEGAPNYSVPADIADRLADPKTAAAAKEELKRMITEEAISEFTARYPSYAEKASQYQAMLDNAAPSGAAASTGATPYTEYFK